MAGNIQRGLTQNGTAIARAIADRATLYRRLAEFFTRYDALICPVVQTRPFPIETPWPAAIEGRSCKTRIDWIAITYIWFLLGTASLSRPTGHDADHLPTAMQLVSPPRLEIPPAVAGRLD